MVRGLGLGVSRRHHAVRGHHAVRRDHHTALRARSPAMMGRMSEASPAARDPRTHTRADYLAFESVTTRWADNDLYGHLNNAVYYELFDTVLTNWLVRASGVDESRMDVFGVVAESSCRFYREVGFPDTIDIGVRVARVGRTSVVFELGMFANGADEIAAHCRWAHVYIDRETRASAPIPDAVRAAVEASLLPE